MVDGLNSQTQTPDELFAGEFDRATKVVTLTGAAALVKGTVLGRTLTGGAVVSAPNAGNTGNGTLTGAAALAGAKVGVYTVTAVEPAANAGVFRVEDPQGRFVGTANVGVLFNVGGQISFTLNDGATDFISGDGFTVTVAAGTEKFKISLAAAVDGSEVPVAILAQDTDVTAVDKKDGVYLTGEFNKAKLTFGAGHTAASTAWDLAQKNIYLRDVVA